MRKIFQCILMAVAVVAMASCSQEYQLDNSAARPVSLGGLNVVVGDFPAFGESRQTRAIGTQDPGKTAWEKDDQILVTLTSQYYGTQTAALTYDGSSWTTAGSFSYLKDETPTVSVFYAPCYEVVGNTLQLKANMKLGMTEYLYGNYKMGNGIMTITFEDAWREYSRLRIAALAEQELSVTTTKFTPAGTDSEITDTFTVTADNNGNAYLYGVFAEEATVIVKQGDVTLADYTFTAEKHPNGTEHHKSYTLAAMPAGEDSSAGTASSAGN